MSRFGSLVKEFLRPGGVDAVAIPPLDGALTANDDLDGFDDLAPGQLSEPDDVLPLADGRLIVSSGHDLVSIESGTVQLVATLDGAVGALALLASGDIVACVGGVGLRRIDRAGHVIPIVDEIDGRTLRCPTAVAALRDGTIYVTEGCADHLPSEWAHDLLARGATGRLIRVTPDGVATPVLDGLRYPHGVCVSHDGSHLLLTESWSHSVSKVALDGSHRVTAIRTNLPGYPARIHSGFGFGSGPGCYWLAVMALRTQLVEFVLEEEDYRDEMVRTIDPEYWIRPALRSIDSGLAPLQGGQIRKLGLVKPWAPPRSYGLVVAIDDDGAPIRSYHSRPGARRHGVLSARQRGSSLYVACKGGDAVLTTDAPNEVNHDGRDPA